MKISNLTLAVIGVFFISTQLFGEKIGLNNRISERLNNNPGERTFGYHSLSLVCEYADSAVLPRHILELEQLFASSQNLSDGYSLLKAYDNWLNLQKDEPENWRFCAIKRLDLQKTIYYLDHNRELVPEIAANSGNLARNFLLNGKPKEACQYAIAGLEIAPQEIWIFAILAPGYLFSGDVPAATRIYAEYNTYAFPGKENKSFRDVFVSDLEIYKTQYPNQHGIAEIETAIKTNTFPDKVLATIPKLDQAFEWFLTASNLENGDSIQQLLRNSALIYEELLREDWFWEYFKFDLKTSIVLLVTCSLELERDPSNLPVAKNPSLIYNLIEDENMQMVRLMSGSPNVDYNFLTVRFEILAELNRILRKKQPDNGTFKQQTLFLFGNMAGAQIYNRDFEGAIRSVNQALIEFPGDGWLMTRLALALLGQGETEKALQIYAAWKDKPFPYSGFKTMKERFLFDLNRISSFGISMKGAAEVRALLDSN